MRIANSVILLALALAAGTGCGPKISRHPQIRSVAVVDFRGLSADGFLISPDPYVGEHQPLGLVFATLQGAAEESGADSHGAYSHWHGYDVSVDSAVGLAKARSRELGADGLTNISIEATPRTVGYGGYTITVSGWRVTGLAIKRIAP